MVFGWSHFQYSIGMGFSHQYESFIGSVVV